MGSTGIQQAAIQPGPKEPTAASAVKTGTQRISLSPLMDAVVILMVGLLIFGLAYIIGRTILVSTLGNDSPLHIANSEWFNQHLPRIPNWYPLQGGGVSLQRSYPLLPYLIVAISSRLSGITIPEAYRVLSYLSVPVAALCVYVLGWRLLRSKTIGLIAAIFYLLSPVAWSWIYREGYLATTLAIPMLPLIILSFDRVILNVNSGSSYRVRTVWLASLAVAIAFATLLHVVVSAAAIIGLLFYAVFISLTSRRGEKFKYFVASGRYILIAGVIAALLIAFWIIPMVSYSRVVGEHGATGFSPGSIYQPEIAELFSIKDLEEDGWVWFRDSSIPLLVGVFAVFGVGIAFFYSRRALAIGLTGVAAIAYTQLPEIPTAIAEIWPMWPAIFRVRSVVILASVTLPLVAAYFLWGVATSIPNSIRNLFYPKRKNEPLANPVIKGVIGTGRSLLVLVVVFSLIYLTRNVSAGSETRISYGLTRAGFEANDIWRIGAEAESVTEQLRLSNWPAFEVASEDPSIQEAIAYAAQLPEDVPFRFDISPFLGRLAQNIAFYSSGSQINTYIWNANLLPSMWGYQQAVSFINSEESLEVGNPHTLNEVANWFGLEYALLNVEFDDAGIYYDAGWVKTFADDKLEIWHNSEAPALATYSGAPTLLVISQDELGGYETIFRLATQGASPYGRAMLVRGEEEVDAYDLDELNLFDAVILHGYSYSNSDRAWELLGQYVHGGGSLFVDTGWQWKVPEWEFDRAPETLPVSKIAWTDYGITQDFRIHDQDVVQGIDPTKFAPLEWSGTPWGISGVNMQDVREWGRVVLSVSEHPVLIAGEYGQGRVIWSGMNLISHAFEYKNSEEVALLNALGSWLTGDETPPDQSVNVLRPSPDEIRMDLESLNGDVGGLYWREASHPAWHAYAVGTDGSRNELPIYQAGPGFMLILIKDLQAYEALELLWETSIIDRISGVISVVAVIGLLAVFTDGLLLNGKMSAKFKHFLRRRNSKPKRAPGVAWLVDPQDMPITTDRIERAYSHGEGPDHNKSPSPSELANPNIGSTERLDEEPGVAQEKETSHDPARISRSQVPGAENRLQIRRRTDNEIDDE